MARSLATVHTSATYAVGGLHGEATLLRRLVDRLQPRADDTLIFVGDYVDRGEDSLATIDELRSLATRCHCVFLGGNHDAAWLEVWDRGQFTERPPSLGGLRRACAPGEGLTCEHRRQAHRS